jgi:hypothetical protein
VRNSRSGYINGDAPSAAGFAPATEGAVGELETPLDIDDRTREPLPPHKSPDASPSPPRGEDPERTAKDGG